MIGVVAVVAQAAAQNSGDDASSRLSMAITGLLVLAGLILVATVIFWRMTRPERGGLATGTMRQIAPVPVDGSEAPGAAAPATSAPLAAPAVPPPSASSPPLGTAPPLATRPTPPARPAPAAPPVRPTGPPVASEAQGTAARPAAPRVQSPSQAPVPRPPAAAPQDQGPTAVAPVRRPARRAGPDAVAG